MSGPPAPRTNGLSALAIALTLACGACATPAPYGAYQDNGAEPSHSEEVRGDDTERWWQLAGDPVLASLVEEGLKSNPALATSIARFCLQENEASASAGSLGRRLDRLTGGERDAQAMRAREARIAELALQRATIAEQIALAYIEVRRLQETESLRTALLSQYQDNVEIAGFRNEAGLVPAIDSALARAQDEVARSEVDYDRYRRDTAIERLSALTGTEPDALTARLGESGSLPSVPDTTGISALALSSIEGEATTGAIRREELADAVLREARLQQSLEAALRAVEDARLAYREGAGTMATLYVAEAASFSVRQALVDAHAERIALTFRQWWENDREWAGRSLVIEGGPCGE